MSRRISLAISFAMVLALGVSASASANNFGSSAAGGERVGNDAIHPYSDIALTSGMRAAVDWSLANVFNPTDLNVFFTTGEEDTRLYDDNYGGNGLVAWFHCPGLEGGTHPDRWCADGHIHWNLDYGNSYDTTNERRGIACHELGHSIGLRHTTDAVHGGSCMVSRGNGNYGGSYALTQPELNHINGQYP